MITLGSILWFLGAQPESQESETESDTTLLQLSEELLYAVKTERSTDSLERLLANYTLRAVQQGLHNDTARKVFWINLYNAWFQLLAIREMKTQPDIFTDKSIRFADFVLSLDDVEHGILRRYRWKYSLGYLPQFLPAKTVKKLAVQQIDYRIHFALNCGAKSCPPIAFYSYTDLDHQLDLAARNFLENETTVNVEKEEVRVTKIMQWFMGDFGGKKGIRNIISKYLGTNVSSYSIVFNEYNWEEDLKNYMEK